MNKLKKSFVIEASVENVINVKVDSSTKSWLLQVEVEDIWSKNKLAVKFHDEIVANFAGYTANEMLLLKEKMKTQPQLREDANSAVNKIGNAIQKEKFLMMLNTKVLPPNNYETWVMKLLKKTDDNKHVIMLKIHDEKLD